MLFPIEICENIIDSCRSPRPWWPQTALAKTGSYRTWISCALTCRAWLARSRYNIYYMVELRWAYQVEMLLRTFGESPALADWVVILVVRGEKLLDRSYSDSDRYIPFIQHPLPQYLRKCRLLLLDIDHHCYPAWFIRSIPRVYSGVIGLDLLNTSNIVSLSFKNPEYHLRWISSFPNLRRLATPSYKVKSLDVNIVGYRPPQLEDLLFYPVQILTPRDIDVLMLLARGGSIVNLVLSIQDLDMNIDGISKLATTLKDCHQLQSLCLAGGLFHFVSMEREKKTDTGRGSSGLNRDAVSGTSLASLSSATVIDRRPSVPPWHTLLLAVRSDRKFKTFGLHLRSSESQWEAKGEIDEFIRRHAGKETDTLLKRFSNLRAVVFTLPTWDAMDLQSYRRAIVDNMPQMAGVLVVRESRYEAAEISILDQHVNHLPISALEKWYTSPGQ